jgi:hypothetical protein
VKASPEALVSSEHAAYPSPAADAEQADRTIDRADLCDQLSALLGEGSGARVESLTLRANAYESTYPTEVLTCVMADGSTKQLFLKRLVAERAQWFRPKPPAYEAHVYATVLQHAPVALPRCFGTVRRAGVTCLVLEYLEGAQRVTSPEGLSDAARWLARFHEHSADWLASASDEIRHSLYQYDDNHLRRCLDNLSRAWQSTRPPAWLEVVIERSREALQDYLSASPSALHGEFYPENVLVCGGRVYPVDWESAGLGPGAMDLASLVEGWPEQARTQCIAAYAEVAGREPEDVARQVDLGALCVHLWWLSIWPQRAAPTLERLRRVATRLDLL